MRNARIAISFLLVVFFSVFVSKVAAGDIVEFKKGGKKKCVVLEESEKTVRFLTDMGEVTVPSVRIESIERESDKVNDALREKWGEKKVRTPTVGVEHESKEGDEEASSAATESGGETMPVQRTYDIKITKHKVTPVAVGSGYPVATFRIEDMGTVKGCRLFRVTVINYRNATSKIAVADFYALLSNGARLDPTALEGFEGLNARLEWRKTASGYVAFPTDGKLDKLKLHSEIADFELDLGTGGYTTGDVVF